MMYAGDYDNTMPPWSPVGEHGPTRTAHTPSVTTETMATPRGCPVLQSASGPGLLDPYVKSRDVFICPRSRRRSSMKERLVPSPQCYSSYAYNSTYVGHEYLNEGVAGRPTHPAALSDISGSREHCAPGRWRRERDPGGTAGPMPNLLAPSDEGSGANHSCTVDYRHNGVATLPGATA